MLFNNSPYTLIHFFLNQGGLDERCILFCPNPVYRVKKEVIQMKSQEKTDERTEFKEKGPGTGCCCSENSAEMMANCFESVSSKGSQGMKTMISECCRKMKAFRLFPVIPMALGVMAFLLGYFLGGEIIRILWLILSGTVALVGLLGLSLMGSMCRELNDQR
jgi:hypothetical protein